MRKKLLLLLAVSMSMASSAWALDKVGDVYQIGTAQDLRDFATAVNGGEYGASAVLTANIDLNNGAWTPIGNATNPYTGTFDGKGYAITNFKYTATGDNNGLFGYINNATIKNFSISGELTSSYHKNGVVGFIKGTSKVSHIHSSLTINVSNFKGHTGGVVGGDAGATTDKPVVEYCEYSGTLTHSGSGDCQAGILGYTGYGTVRNCIFSGTIIGQSSKYGGILGYCKQPSFGGVQNCLSIGKIVANDNNTTAAAIIANWNGNATSNVKNNYYCLAEGSTTTIAIGNKATNCEAPVAVTAAQLASGEIAYALNGSQSETVNWFQKIGTDKYPTPYGTDIVYLTGHLHCDGTAYEGQTAYSNSNESTKDEHNFIDGFCSYCNLCDVSYMTPNTDGIYEIGTANQLKWFAAFVNMGGDNMSANVILTNDINMKGVAWTNPIGNWVNSVAYKGHFDGQGHAITDLVYTTTQSYHGLFGVTTTGTVIENFSIAGTITNENYGQFGGVVGYVRDNTTIIRNVKSSMNIVNKKAGQRIGGIVGQAHNGTTKVENCVYSGTLSPNNSTGNYGGIVGYVNNNSAAILNVTNCLFDGEINDGEAEGECGGIVGYIGTSPNVTIENCLSVGHVSSKRAGMICGTIQANNSVVENNYYLGAAANGTTSSVERPSTEVTAVQLASGEVAYKLGAAFGQVIGTDANPVLGGEAVNYVGEAGYATLFDATQGYELKGDAEAFVGNVNGQYVSLTTIGKDVPAATPVVLKGTYYNKIAADIPAINIANQLKGSDGTVEGNGSIYALANKDNGVGFYKVKDGIAIPAGKVYLQTSNAVKEFFPFADDETAIENVNGNVNGNKGAIYNIAGQRLSKMQKGLNIVGGKKVMY
jgi:hypothetical protein